MLNALRAEAYKLKNSKLLRVLLIINIAVSFIGSLIFDFAMNIKIPGAYAAYYFPVLSFFILIMLVIFGSINTTNGFSNLTFKNAISSGTQRWQVYFAKLASSLLVNLLLILLTTLILVVYNSLLHGWSVATVPASLGSEVIILILCILFLSGYIAVFNMVSFLVRNPGVAMAINVCLFFVDIFLNVIVLFPFNGAGKLAMLPSTYIQFLNPPVTFMKPLYTDLFYNTMLKGILLTIAIIVVTTIVGCFAFKRYEIK